MSAASDPLALLIGQSVLVTTDQWFFAPDGNSYKAVFGRLTMVSTPAARARWLRVGDLLLSLDQVRAVVACEGVSLKPPLMENYDGMGVNVTSDAGMTRIWIADAALRDEMAPDAPRLVVFPGATAPGQVASGREDGGAAAPGRNLAAVPAAPEAGCFGTGTAEPAAGPAESCPAAAGQNFPAAAARLGPAG